MIRAGRARRQRTMLTAAMVVTAGAVSVGCSSGGASSSSAPATSTASAAASSSPGASSAAASAAASASASASASSSANAAAASGAPGCATRDLQATVGIAQGAAGSVYQVIDFRNISGATCTLFGYPGVALAGGTPVTQIGAAASRSTATAATLVTLAAGETANALVRITQAANYPTAQCDPVAATYLQIFPPNQTTPIYLAYKSTGCSSTAVNLLSVSVMQAGNGG